MKDWLIGIVVEFLLKQLTQKNVEKLANQIQCFLVPVVRAQKDEIIAKLKAKAKETATPIDDAAYLALDVFFEAFLPDTSQCFLNLKK
jgi:hypothetical protein